MLILHMILAGALSALPPVLQNDLIAAGLENNRHVLVSLGGVPEQPTGPFSASLFAVPANWPANGSTYQVWIAEFDCAARTRTMKFRTVYSSRRDPVRTELTDAPVESAAGPIAAQLDILCGNATRAARRSFNNVGEFTRALRQ